MSAPARLLACLAAALLLAGCGADRTLYTGGPVLTVDGEDRVVEALGVEGDRIAFVGSRAEGGVVVTVRLPTQAGAPVAKEA